MPSASLEPVFTPRRARHDPWSRWEGRAARRLEALLAGGAWGSLAPELSPALRPSSPPPAPARSRNRLGRILRGLGLGLLLGHAVFIATTSLLILSYRFTNPSITVLMAYRKWSYGWKLQAPRPLSLRSIPSYLRSMLVSVEDGKFYEHHGLDFEAFQRAYEVNSRLNRPLYGGSTLTMQVARTLFLVPEKSYIRKYLEVLVALELELFLPKERILELYFGYAEWGKGIFGIEAAARHYFGRGLGKLSRDQSARLIALLSSPIKYSPSTLEKSGILRERYRYLLRRYLGSGPPAPDAPQPESAAGTAPSPSAPGESLPGASPEASAGALPGSSPTAPPEAPPEAKASPAAGQGAPEEGESTETAPLPEPFRG